MTSIPSSMRLQSLQVNIYDRVNLLCHGYTDVILLILCEQNEPKRLLSEADRLNEELDSLVMDNYRVFIDNLTCSVFLRNEVCLEYI